jgi:hypothetical protein
MSSLYMPPHHPNIPLRPDGRPYPRVRPRALSEATKEAQRQRMGSDGEGNLRRVRWPLLLAVILGAGILVVGSQIMSVLS